MYKIYRKYIQNLQFSFIYEGSGGQSIFPQFQGLLLEGSEGLEAHSQKDLKAWRLRRLRKLRRLGSGDLRPLIECDPNLLVHSASVGARTFYRDSTQSYGVNLPVGFC